MVISIYILCGNRTGILKNCKNAQKNQMPDMNAKYKEQLGNSGDDISNIA